ncbi:MAG: mechanosensitive ion channel [Acidobacteria bacterium]|nr:mechanosensitive ion channel [Acidobacteriota bacterium]
MHKAAYETIDYFMPLAIGGARMLVLVVIGYVATLIVNRLIRAIRNYAVKVISRGGDIAGLEVEKRANTLSSVVRRVSLTLLWAAIVMMALQELGFKIDALLAGAGVSAGIIGVAVGFGAQSLIKDVLAGLFMLIENQIRVNDVAIINGVGGSVEEINLRTTVLRAENGAVHIIPNGSIQTLANLTLEFSYYVLEIALNHEQDAERAIAIMNAIAADLRGEDAWTRAILADLEMMGIDRISVNGVTVKARIKTQPTRQWAVGRELNRRIHARFAAAGIDLGVGPASVRLAGGEELKTAIREVLAEMGIRK